MSLPFCVDEDLAASIDFTDILRTDWSREALEAADAALAAGVK